MLNPKCRRNLKPKLVTSPSNLNEIHLQGLRTIENNPGLTQRQLAQVLEVSLGKARYCIKALMGKGLVKMGSCSHNQKKTDHAYHRTPGGMKRKASLTADFLKRKAVEYALLKSELEKHENEIKHLGRKEKISIAEEAAL